MTTENNKLLAEFMGVKPEITGYYSGRKENWYDGYQLHKAGLPFNYGAMGNGTNDLKFHNCWDWLMPVVDKIESFGYMVKILTGRTNIGERMNVFHISQYEESTKLENTYKAVIEFINHHNKS